MRDPLHHAKRELSPGLQLLERLEREGAVEVVDAGEPQPVGGGLRIPHEVRELPRGRGGMTACTRCIAFSRRMPDGHAVPAVHDLPAFGVGACPARCPLSRSASEFTHSAWPLLASRHDGVAGRGPVQRPRVRERAVSPDVVVPPRARDPGAGGSAPARAAHPGHAPPPAWRSPRPRRRRDSAYHLKCRWASVRPGSTHLPAEVDHLGPCRPSAARAPVLVPDVEEAPVADSRPPGRGAARHPSCGSFR